MTGQITDTAAAILAAQATKEDEQAALLVAIAILRQRVPDWFDLYQTNQPEAERRRLVENALMIAWQAENVTDLNAWAHTLLRALDRVQPTTQSIEAAAAAGKDSARWMVQSLIDNPYMIAETEQTPERLPTRAADRATFYDADRATQYLKERYQAEWAAFSEAYRETCILLTPSAPLVAEGG